GSAQLNGQPFRLRLDQLLQRLLITVTVGTRVEMAGPLPDDRTRDCHHLGIEVAPAAAGAPKAARHGLAVPCGAPIMEAQQCFTLAHWEVSQAACTASKSCWERATSFA